MHAGHQTEGSRQGDSNPGRNASITRRRRVAVSRTFRVLHAAPVQALPQGVRICEILKAISDRVAKDSKSTRASSQESEQLYMQPSYATLTNQPKRGVQGALSRRPAVPTGTSELSSLRWNAISCDPPTDSISERLSVSRHIMPDAGPAIPRNRTQRSGWFTDKHTRTRPRRSFV